jgi:hypothetical protein
VTAAGETVTVTLLRLTELPPPQPVMTFSRTSDSTQRARDKFITDLQQEDYLNIFVTMIPASFLGSQAVGSLHPGASFSAVI